MSANRHVILSHVDSAVKILLWTKGELLLMLVPFFGGIFFDTFALGIVTSAINGYGIRTYKKRFGKGLLQAVIYWYLPPLQALKCIPQSCVRKLIG